MNSLTKRMGYLLAVILIALSSTVFLSGCKTDTGNGDAAGTTAPDDTAATGDSEEPVSPDATTPNGEGTETTPPDGNTNGESQMDSPTNGETQQQDEFNLQRGQSREQDI